MPLKNFLTDLKSQVKDLQRQGQDLLSNHQQQQPQNQHQYQQQSYPQQQYQSAGQYQQPGPYQAQQQPPPIPQSTHPSYQAHNFQNQGLQQQSRVTWQPQFQPNIPISQEWEHKVGNNNGWGNNEIENYTAEPGNSFYTPNNLLVLRAVSQPNNPDASKRYTSARLVSHRQLGINQGSLTATLTLPCAPGIWPAFWLLPREPFTWPTDGEVDIAETWNGDGVNHSCLHWGFYTPQDKPKHRVIGTPCPNMRGGRPVKFEFAWQQELAPKRGGRMLWWIDGVAVMKAAIPGDMNRRLEEFVVLLNVAMGGNVCQGVLPGEGSYDFVVHEMRVTEEPGEGGWGRFERDWGRTREGDMI